MAANSSNSSRGSYTPEKNTIPIFQLSPQKKFPNRGRGKVEMIRPGIWDTDTLRNVAEIEHEANGVDMNMVRANFANLSEAELVAKVKEIEDEITAKIQGSKSDRTSTQLLEALLQELEVLIKIRRENIITKLHHPEAIGTTFCPMEQGLKRRTVGDRSFTDVDNSLTGKQQC